jgi:Domain of unknown function (DUF5050)
VVALGLTLRFTLNKKDTPTKPKVPPTQPAPGSGAVVPVPPTPTPDLPPTPVEPEKPKEPRIAGSVEITDDQMQFFGVGPDAIYYCNRSSMVKVPKAGGDSQVIGDCESAMVIVADNEGVFWCEMDKLMRITTGTNESHVVHEGQCMMGGIDERYVYFVNPGFNDDPDEGLWKIERSGGTPEKLFDKANKKEQYSITLARDAIWFTGYFHGVVFKLAKGAGAKPQQLVFGQKNLEDFGVDDTYMYWAVEGANELRRRKQTGGAIETIATNIKTYPFRVVDGHVYWFQRGDETWKLMHLAPGTQEAEVLAANLGTPGTMEADAQGVYITELDRPGVFWFKR